MYTCRITYIESNFLSDQMHKTDT
ncbi:hypothetical protein DMN91_007439, partial [Ooceraea biroi]